MAPRGRHKLSARTLESDFGSRAARDDDTDLVVVTVYGCNLTRSLS
jgi:hypothetical protein